MPLHRGALRATNDDGPLVVIASFCPMETISVYVIFSVVFVFRLNIGRQTNGAATSFDTSVRSVISLIFENYKI